MKLKFPRLRLFDYIAACFAVGLIAATAVTAYSGRSNASHVRVQTAGGAFVYNLGADTKLEFEGPIGSTHLEIHDGAARVTSSPCREQICVNSGALTQGGDWTACLPNRIFFEIVGEDESEVDSLSY